MRSFLILVGFSVGVVGYAIVYDGAAAIAAPAQTQGGIQIPVLPFPGAPSIGIGGHGVKGTSRAFPWGRLGIIASLIPGRESAPATRTTGAGQIAPQGGGAGPLSSVRYV